MSLVRILAAACLENVALLLISIGIAACLSLVVAYVVLCVVVIGGSTLF
jgi:hypothetical protein